MKTRTTIGIVLTFTLSGALLYGCGESGSAPKPAEPLPQSGQFGQAPVTPPQPVDEGTPVDGDWIILRMPDEPPHVNPITASDLYARQITELVFDTLIYRSHATFEYEPRIAESWDVSPDHLTYTFHLRKDVKFSDGVPLTAEDVKFTFDRIKDPTVDDASLRNYFNEVVSCETPDPYTVVFTCSKPYFQHLGVVGEFEIIPKHIYGEGNDFNNHPNNRKPVGAGPFVFERWDTGSQIVLTRNDNYYGIKPHVKKIVYKIITDNNAAFQVLERQELDAMTLTPEVWVKRASKPDFQAKFNLLSYYPPQVSFFMWNERRPQFADKRVRKAMTMLLDRQLILDTIFRGFGRLARRDSA
jgi:peptide/nickel transport system substrate-binding protein